MKKLTPTQRRFILSAIELKGAVIDFSDEELKDYWGFDSLELSNEIEKIRGKI